MRLICPNCSAAYEIEAGLIGGGGSHVQCSACQTRWFEREPAAERPDEDQIVARLETRPRLATVEPLRPAPAPEPVAFRSASRPPAPPPEPIEVAETIVTPLRPRPGVERPAAVAPKQVAPVRTVDRFAPGFALALGVAGAGLVAYLFAEDLGRRVPAGAAPMAGYVAGVDAQRERVEARFGPLRDKALNAVFPEG